MEGPGKLFDIDVPLIHLGVMPEDSINLDLDSVNLVDLAGSDIAKFLCDGTLHLIEQVIYRLFIKRCTISQHIRNRIAQVLRTPFIPGSGVFVESARV